MKSKQWIFIISLVALLVSFAFTWGFAMTVWGLKFSGGFGGSRFPIHILEKEELYWICGIAFLTAIVSTIFTLMSKLKIYTSITITVLIIITIINLYALTELIPYPVGTLAIRLMLLEDQ